MVYINSIVSEKREKQTIHLWKKADFSEIRNHIRLFTDNILKSYSIDTPVEQPWKLIIGELNSVIQTLVLSKAATTRFNQPWVNKEVKSAKRMSKTEIQPQD